MKRIVLRHISGSKAGQIDEYPLAHHSEITIGRDPSAKLVYDANRDDLVGRQHAHITRDPAAPDGFNITDLQSRNGTFVNRQRINGTVRLMPGDVVQLGPGGPQFEFDLDPRPAGQVRSTRVADAASSGRATVVPPPPTRGNRPDRTNALVGKATVERMVAQGKRESRRVLLLGGGALMLLFASLAGLLWSLGPGANAIPLASAGSTISPGEIVERFGQSVVHIDMSWKLVNTRTGRQIFHQYIPNVWKDKDGVARQIIPDGRAAVATYIVLGDNSYEPALEDSLSSRHSQPIGGSGGGTGFAVTSDGFIFTARHVGATWLTEYQYPEDAYPGVIWTQVGGKWTLVTNSETGMPQTFRPPRRWVPAQTRQFGRDGMRWAVEGRHDFLNVTFPKNKTPVPGRIARISDRHDVMMLKIEVPQEVAKCELNDNYETIKAGDQITVLGYPAASPMVYGPIRSQDVFNRETQYKMIPEPSLTTGNVGRILREKNDKESETSEFGDAYQITATPGSGNSGGPVFDDKGRVIGIYFASSRVGVGQFSFAVPVRYAMELMTTTPK